MQLSKQSIWNHVKACIAGTNNCAKFNILIFVHFLMRISRLFFQKTNDNWLIAKGVI